MANKNNYVNKLRTGISGLDNLFYNGIQLQPIMGQTDNVSSDIPNEGLSKKKSEGIIIVVRGSRGIHKMQLAMQMFQGLTREIREQIKDNWSENPKFFSLNKSNDNLQDMYLDLLIGKEINKAVRESISGSNTWSNQLLSNHLFRIIENYRDRTCAESWQYIPPHVLDHIDKYLCNRSIYYNSRTNALHFRREGEGDDNNNILFERTNNELKEYANKEDWPKEMEEMKKDFFEVVFNEHEKSDNDEAYYAETALQKFHKILSVLENVKSEDAVTPCVLIDGFSLFSNEELLTLPLNHLIKTLRKRSLVSILVFDDRCNNISYDADIVIDMRRNTDTACEYTFHELQISKSVFQPTVLGWHQYKLRPHGIEVFPSLHRVMQRRNYLSYIADNTTQSIMDESYEEYLRSVKKVYEKKDYSYREYLDGLEDRKDWLLKEMYSRNIDNIKSGYNPPDICNILDDVILGKAPEFHFKEQENKRWKCHKDITAIIGNPNSFKRVIANASIFDAARRGEHTLIILFDKEESDMCRQIVCPAFYHEAPGEKYEWMPCNDNKDSSARYQQSCKSCRDNYHCKLKKECSNCYKNIHFLGLRMGCLSADELFFILDDLLSLTIGSKQMFSHVVIDDLQKVDFSFPFLKDTTLFLPALITLFRRHNVSAKILSDKVASLTTPLCSMADNVVCIKREEDDENSMTMYIERNSTHLVPSQIYRYKIDSVPDIFRCAKDAEKGLFIMKQNLDKGTKDLDKSNQEAPHYSSACGHIEFQTIGSMKEYWRTKYGILQEEDHSIDKNEEKVNNMDNEE